MAGNGDDRDARQRIEALEAEVRMLRQAVAELQQATAWREVPEGRGPELRAPQGPPEGRAGAAGEGPATEAPVGRPEDTAARPGLESVIGTRWLAAAGVILTVVAAALFLRLAIVRGWIGPLAQLLLIAALGVLVWALGAVLHRRARFRGFAETLAAGGVAITSFAAFASHQLPRYAPLDVSVEASTGMLAAIAVLALLDAALRQTRVQAAASIALVVVTGLVAREWTAFAVAYPVVMTGALLAAGAWRRWGWMPSAALPGPFVLLAWQAARGAPPTAIGIAAGVLIVAFSAMGLRARAEEDAIYAGGAQAAAWLAGWGLILWSLRDARVDIDGWVTLGLGAAALGLALLPWPERAVRWGWTAAALPMLILWAPLLPWPAAVAPIWSAQLVLTAGLALRRNHVTLVGVQGAVAVLQVFRFLDRELPRIDARVDGYVFDVAIVVFGVVAVAAAWAMQRHIGLPATSSTQPWLPWIARGVLAAGVLDAILLFVALWDGPAVSLAIALWGAALTVAGFILRSMDLRIAGLSVFGIVLLRIVLVDLAGVDAVWRVLAFFLIGALLLGVSFLYVRLARRLA